MAHYVIGDVHAHPDALEALCTLIAPSKDDCLIFVGDLVGKGPDDWGTLAWLKRPEAPRWKLVLGNHDLHFLAKAHKNYESLNSQHKQYLEVLHQGTLCYQDLKSSSLVVHAGIWPGWSAEELLLNCKNAEKALLRAAQMQQLHLHLYGNEDHWHPALNGWERVRSVVNITTRMRCLHRQTQRLDLSYTGSITNMPPELIPWFQSIANPPSKQIVFGHWAQLHGKTHKPGFFAVDHGYTYGGALSAFCLETAQIFSYTNPCG